MPRLHVSSRKFRGRGPYRRWKCFPTRLLIAIGAIVILLSVVSLPTLSATGQGSASGNDYGDMVKSIPEALGEARSVNVSPTFGAVSDYISIEVPPGRRNVQPQLSLTYSSSGGPGDVGLGWQLDIGQIERWKGDGTPSVGDPDAFAFSIAGLGGEMRTTGDGVYRATRESVYREFRYVEEALEDHWEMYDGEGNLHRFGGTDESRVIDSDGNTQIWMLDLVRDRIGNTINYYYCRGSECINPTEIDEDGALYLKEIRYTGFEPTGDLGANLVEFEYEERPDVRISYNYSVRQERCYRLHRISIFAGEDLVRRYELAYDQSPMNGQSLLKSITLVGADDESRITLRTVEYSSRPLGWNYSEIQNGQADELPAFADPDGRDMGVRAADVNGDGFADIVKAFPDQEPKVYLGDGKGSFTVDDDWGLSLKEAAVVFCHSHDLRGADWGLRLVDVNADGLPDLFVARPKRYDIFLNTGNGWEKDQGWTNSLASLTEQAGADKTFLLAGPKGESRGVELGDFNADGRLDILWSWMYEMPSSESEEGKSVCGVFLNTGTGWEKNDELTNALYLIPYFLVEDEPQGYGLLDVNGDGLADIVRASMNDSEVWLSTGRGWIRDELNDFYEQSLRDNDIVSHDSDNKSLGLTPIDFDDDGLVDYLIAKEGSDPRAYHNTGTGWEESSEMSDILSSSDIVFANSEGRGSGVFAVDVDGDGLVDILEARQTANWGLKQYYSTIQTANVSSDDVEEVLGRGVDGMQVYGFDGTDWTAYGAPGPFKDSDNWAEPKHYSTIQTANVFGDAEAEILGRGVDGMQVYSFDGTSWNTRAGSGPFEDLADWYLAQYYLTIQAGDVTGNATEEVLGRGDNGMQVYRFDGSDWHTLTASGPFSNTVGWDDPNHYLTIQTANVSGNATEEVLGRGDSGMQVYRFDGSDWHTLTGSGPFSNTEGWDDPNHYLTIQMADINGDGMDEVLGRGDSGMQVYRFDGSDWYALAGSGPFSNTEGWDDPNHYLTIQTADINGDGMDEVLGRGPNGMEAYGFDGTYWITYKVSGPFYDTTGGSNVLWLSSNLRSGMMVKATSALGEETEIEWKSSTSFDNRRTDWEHGPTPTPAAGGIQGLPGAMPVATSLARHDGRGNVSTTGFEYGGGLYSDLRFRGFAWSKETMPNGLTMTMYYHQDDDFIGMTYLTEGYDINGDLRLREKTVYESVSMPPVTQIRRIETEDEVLDPGGTQHSHVKYEYDERLNAVSLWKDPEVGIQHDECTTLFTWLRNDAAGIWSLYVRTQILGWDNRVLSDSVILYDGMGEGEMADRGLPSETQDLVEAGYYVKKFMWYDQYGNVVKTRDREGKDCFFEYDETGTFRTWVKDQEGRVVESGYDRRFGSLIWDKDMGGHTSEFEYDEFGRLLRVLLPGDSRPFWTRIYTYSDLGIADNQFYCAEELKIPGEPGMLKTKNYFDGMGQIYRVELDGSHGRTVVAQTEFDDAGNMVWNSQPFFDGDTSSAVAVYRDELRRPVHVVAPDGTELNFTYHGLRADMEDQRGFKTSFHRNADGQVIRIEQEVDGTVQATSYTYDEMGRLTKIIDALNCETNIAYDGLGRRIRFEDPNAGTYEYVSDDEGRLIDQKGPDGQHTYFHYNDAGDLLRKEFPDGTSLKFQYDSGGQIVRIEDAAGTLDLEYDLRGNIAESRRAVLGRTYVTGYDYDSLSRVQRITYPDGFIVNYEYDSGGNIARVTDGQGRVIADIPDYNASNQIMRIVFGNDVWSNFNYNEQLRMTSIDTSAADGEILQDLEYGYDAGGNILSITDNAFGASQTFEYDSISRLTRAVGPYGDESYEYDAIGNLLRKGDLVFTLDPEHPQRVIGGVYLSSDMVTSSEEGKGETTGLNREAGGKWSQVLKLEYDDRGNVVLKAVMLCELESDGQLTEVKDTDAKTVQISTSHFVYDSENNLLSVRDKNGKVLEENVYDAAGQRVVQRTPQGTNIFISGIYEESKNHASRHVMVGQLLVATIMTPLSDVQLIDKVSHGPLGSSGGGSSAQNMAVMLPFIIVGLGVGLIMYEKRGWIHYFDGLLDRRSLMRKHPFMTTLMIVLIPVIIFVSTTQAAYASQVHTSNVEKGIGSEQRYYYHSNHLGSVNVVTNDQGKVVEVRNYRPYGDPFGWTGPNSGPRELLVTFDGHRYDDATGLYYFGARYYDPEIGRFLTADTLVPDPMNPKSLNRYAFCGGNPIRYSDPSGHGWWELLLGVLLFFAVVITLLTFGAGSALCGAILIGLIVGFFVGMVGAGVYAIVNADQYANAGGFELLKILLTGALLGALIGAGLAALPFSFGLGGATTLQIIIASAVVGAATGAIEQITSLYAGGKGSVDTLWDWEMLKNIGTGAAFGLVMGCAGEGAGAAAGWALKGLRPVVGTITKYQRALTAIFRASRTLKIGSTGVDWGWEGISLLYAGILSSLDHTPRDIFWDFVSIFRSPRQSIGIPAWAFAGVWPAVGGSSQYSAELQTMPLAP